MSMRAVHSKLIKNVEGLCHSTCRQGCGHCFHVAATIITQYLPLRSHCQLASFGLSTAEVQVDGLGART